MIAHHPEVHRIPSPVALCVPADVARDVIDEPERLPDAGGVSRVGRLVTGGERGEGKPRPLAADARDEMSGDLLLERRPRRDVAGDVRANHAQRMPRAPVELARSWQAPRDHGPAA